MARKNYRQVVEASSLGVCSVWEFVIFRSPVLCWFLETKYTSQLLLSEASLIARSLNLVMVALTIVNSITTCHGEVALPLKVSLCGQQVHSPRCCLSL
jgi:hypothetical protein